MSGSNEATSACSSSVHMELGGEESHSSRCEYTSDESFGFERESSASSPSEEEVETHPPGQVCKTIIPPSIWLVIVFPVSMMKEVFNRLRPHFRIPGDIPIKKVDK